MPILSVAYGRNQNQAIDLTPVFLERFVKDDEANAMLSRSQRKPYGTTNVKIS